MTMVCEYVKDVLFITGLVVGLGFGIAIGWLAFAPIGRGHD